MKASDVRNKLDKLIKESEVIDPLTDKLCKEWEEGCGWAGVIQKQINKAVENKNSLEYKLPHSYQNQSIVSSQSSGTDGNSGQIGPE